MSLPGAHGKEIVDTIISLRSQQELAKYLAIASLTLLVYDWLLNLDFEVKFIWGSPWSWGRLAYHVVRIWPLVLLCITLPVILFIPLPQPSLCKRVAFLYSYGIMCECTVIASLLIVRCWALYSQKRILWSLCFGLACAFASGLYFIKVLLDRSIFMKNPLPNIFSGCTVIIPSNVWMMYITPMAYESCVFFLTIWKIWRMSRDFGATPLMQRLAQNGVLYFAVIVLIMVLSCVGGTIDAVKIPSNGSGILSSVTSVVCSRMIFSLHRLIEAERQEGLAGSYSVSQTAGVPRFAIPLASMNASTSARSTTR